MRCWLRLECHPAARTAERRSARPEGWVNPTASQAELTPRPEERACARLEGCRPAWGLMVRDAALRLLTTRF